MDLGVLEDFPSNRIPGFSDALVGLLPSLDDHACSLGRRGGFISRLREGTWAGHIAEHIALELQNLAGTDVRHGKTRGAGPPGQYNVIYEYREEQVGIQAGKIAVDLVNHLILFPRIQDALRLAVDKPGVYVLHQDGVVLFQRLDQPAPDFLFGQAFGPFPSRTDVHDDR